MSRQSLVTVAKMLQEAAETLLKICPESPPDEPPPDDEDTKHQDEYRSYRVPFHVLDDEQYLLDKYQVERVADALSMIYDEFYLMLSLLKGYAEGLDDEGYIYFLFTEHLKIPLDMLSKGSSQKTENKAR